MLTPIIKKMNYVYITIPEYLYEEYLLLGKYSIFEDIREGSGVHLLDNEITLWALFKKEEDAIAFKEKLTQTLEEVQRERDEKILPNLCF